MSGHNKVTCFFTKLPMGILFSCWFLLNYILSYLFHIQSCFPLYYFFFIFFSLFFKIKYQGIFPVFLGTWPIPMELGISAVFCGWKDMTVILQWFKNHCLQNDIFPSFKHGNSEVALDFEHFKRICSFLFDVLWLSIGIIFLWIGKKVFSIGNIWPNIGYKLSQKKSLNMKILSKIESMKIIWKYIANIKLFHVCAVKELMNFSIFHHQCKNKNENIVNKGK